MNVSFIVAGIPRPKGSMKALMRPGARYPTVLHDNNNTKQWQARCASTARAAVGSGFTLLAGPVSLVLVFTLPRPASLPKRVVYPIKKPDASKLVRTIEDALTGVVYRDDAQVVEILARKVYAVGRELPSVCVTVLEVDA